MPARSIPSLVFDSGVGGLSPCSAESQRRCPTRVTSISPTMQAFPMAVSAGRSAGHTHRACHRQVSPSTSPISCGGLQHRSTLALTELRANFRTLCRHRAGDQTRLRAVRSKARRGAWDARRPSSREYTRADPRIRQGCESRSSAPRTSRRSLKPSLPVSHRRQYDQGRNRGLLRRLSRHRHRGRPCLHTLPVADRPSAVAPWPVDWLDPAPAIARRVTELMRDWPPASAPPGPRIVFTSGRVPSPALTSVLAGYGF